MDRHERIIQAIRSVPILRGAEVTLPGKGFAIQGPIRLSFGEADAIADAIDNALRSEGE